MFPQMQCFRARKVISGNEFDQLISALKNRILDFVIKIAAENPDAGEAQLNSQPVKAEALQQLVTNHFSGPIRNFAQYSHDFSQTANSEIQHDELAEFVKLFTEHLDQLNLDETQTRKAAAQLATIHAQLSDEPNPVIVQEAGRSLRSITENAIGGMLTTAIVNPDVWHWIQKILSGFQL